MERTWTHRRARCWPAVAAGGLAAVLFVAGCTAGDPDPTPAPPASADASTTGTPEPSPSASSVVVKPERPAAMDDEGAEGAAAAAQYFLQLDSYIQATNDTAEWEAMSHQTCEYCASRLDQARLIAERRDAFEGGETDVRVLETYEQDPTTGIWPVDVEVTETASSVKDSSGAEVFSNDASVGQLRMEIGRRDGQWVVVGVGDVPES